MNLDQVFIDQTAMGQIKCTQISKNREVPNAEDLDNDVSCFMTETIDNANTKDIYGNIGMDSNMIEL